jgi:hypothetical protein
MVKASVELTQFRSSHLEGCPPKYLAGSDIEPPLLSVNHSGDKQVPSPAFLVPAVLDALRKRPNYGSLVSVVPGEADAFCASHLKIHGGVVLTSDSDLLVHDVGAGRVAFFRDMYDHDDKNPSWKFSSYNMNDILARNGLESSGVDARRLGYEIHCNRNSSFNAMVISCLQDTKAKASLEAFEEFCRQYVDHEIGPLPHTAQGSTIEISDLDPRISELVLQLGNKPDAENDPVMFLPILIEDATMSSAWVPSAPIRQLAYTVFTWLLPEDARRRQQPIQEYRRVQTIQQRGRSVSVLSKPAALDAARVIIGDTKRLKSLVGAGSEIFWILLCLASCIRECQEQEKQSHCLSALRSAHADPPSPNPRKVSWSLIHFTAHIQASYYSFRMLTQIIALIPKGEWKYMPGEVAELRDELSDFPGTGEFPEFDTTADLLGRVGELHMLDMLGHLVHVPAMESAVEYNKRKKRKKSKETPEGGSKRPLKQQMSGNIFSVLEDES